MLFERSNQIHQILESDKALRIEKEINDLGWDADLILPLVLEEIIETETITYETRTIAESIADQLLPEDDSDFTDDLEKVVEKAIALYEDGEVELEKFKVNFIESPGSNCFHPEFPLEWKGEAERIEVLNSDEDIQLVGLDEKTKEFLIPYTIEENRNSITICHGWITKISPNKVEISLYS